MTISKTEYLRNQRKAWLFNSRLRQGMPLIYSWNDFDGSGSFPAIVTEIYPDHAIAESDHMTLWIDVDNAELFNEASFCDLAMMIYESFCDLDYMDYNDTKAEEIELLSAMIQEKGISATYDYCRQQIEK